MHRHLCSHCAAVITLDEGCQSENDHTDGACEACAFAQPDLEEVLPDAKVASEASAPRTIVPHRSKSEPAKAAPRADRNHPLPFED
jgi:hypothetical protein